MDDNYISLIAKYLSGDIDQPEQEALFELVNSSEENKAYFEEMQNIWNNSASLSDDLMVDTDLAWQKVASRINPVIQKKEKSPPEIFHFRPLLKIAAVFAGIIVAIWIYNNNQAARAEFITYQTLSKETKNLTLPDGSKVWMNEHSSLRFDKNFESRIVHLVGEAFFEVQKMEDSKFEILTGETKTTVLGTAFNVRAYPDEPQVEVTVANGKVLFEDAISRQKEQKVILTKGDSGIFEKENEKISKVENAISNANAWKTRQLDFKDARLSEVISVMERYFDIEIQTVNNELLDCPFTGVYQQPEIEQMIKVLEFSLNLEIKENENILTFSGEGCQ